MTDLIQIILPYIPSSAIPIVIVVLGCCYLWFRCKQNFEQMNRDKEETLKNFDNESQDLHDLCKENVLEIKNLKEELSQKNEILDTLRSQVNELNVNLAIVSERIVTLVDVIKGLKNESFALYGVDWRSFCGAARMNKLDFKNLVVKEILYISGEDCVMALEESKSFKRRYQLDSDVEYRVITNQGELHIFLKKWFEFDGRSGTPIVDFVAPNLGTKKERFTWLTHDVNGYDLDLSFSDTNNLLWVMLVYLCGYSKFKASIIRYAVSLSKSWFGKPKKNDWCYKNVNKVSARWFPYDNI